MLRGFLFVVLCVVVKAEFEGEACMKNGVVGICKNIRKCKSALEDIRNRIHPQICTFDNADPIVCCTDTLVPSPVTTTNPALTQAPLVTTTKRPANAETTTEYEPPVYDYVTNDRKGKPGCPPLNTNLTSAKTGQKAWDKCLEYQEALIYPCEKTVSLSFNSGMERKNKCLHNADSLIIGGQNASKNEFPHMVLLGFGDEPNIEWQCGGSLISDKFILTAGHCLSSRDAGNLNYAYVGALARSEVPKDSTRQYRIKQVIKHPDYHPPNRYNDIALVELEKRVSLTEYTVPACLHVGDAVEEAQVVATGWGLTQYEGSSSNILQKVQLNKFSSLECMLQYPTHRHMKQGFDANTQTCYGDKQKSKDTCQGDSGGPIQIKHRKINCMYLILGVTSFGRACGFIGEPGIYTRVAHYVPWIESIVWP